MKQIIDQLTAARQQRPDMTIQDAVKLLYQRSVGPGHLITDPQRAMSYLSAEFSGCEGTSLALYEPIGNDLCRVNLAPYRALGGKADTLFHLLLHCVDAVQGDWDAFLGSLDALIPAGFPVDDVEPFLAGYRAAGCPAVHHSDAYRRAYSPAYRICLEQDARYLPLLAYLDGALVKHTPQQPFLLAIEGQADSGKSTLANLLKRIYGCQVLHMDDFFLPIEKKTPERLAQPGGNVDWERFSREILQPLTQREPLLLRPFDCQTGTLQEAQLIPYTSLMVVEGAYSLHPALNGPYHCKVFLSLSPMEQEARILCRNGPELAERFRNEWIPMENHYFQTFSIPKRCDFIFA